MNSSWFFQFSRRVGIVGILAFIAILSGWMPTSVARADSSIRGFPVSVGLAQTSPTCVTLSAVADTFLNAEKPTENKGTDAALYSDSESSKPIHAVLQFDLSTIPGAITSADVYLYQNGNSGAVSTINAHRVTAAWNETQATWNNRLTGTAWSSAGGDFDATVAGSFVANSNNIWRNFSVTALAEQWRTSAVPNYGILLESTLASGNNEKKYGNRSGGG